MDKKSKTLLIMLLSLILMSVALTYYNDIVVRSFDVIDTTATEGDNTISPSKDGGTMDTSGQVDNTESPSTTN